jgi:hypothetical protein
MVNLLKSDFFGAIPSFQPKINHRFFAVKVVYAPVVKPWFPKSITGSIS